MKNETVTFVFSSSFLHQQCFFYFSLHTNILVALQKSLEVMCCFILLWRLQWWLRRVAMETQEDPAAGGGGGGGAGHLYIYLCINIWPQTRCCDEREVVKFWNLSWKKKTKPLETSEERSYNQRGRRLSWSCLPQTPHAQWPPLCHQLVHWWEKLLIATDSIFFYMYTVVCVNLRGGEESLVDDTSWPQLNQRMDTWSPIWDDYKTAEFKIKDVTFIFLL